MDGDLNRIVVLKSKPLTNERVAKRIDAFVQQQIQQRGAQLGSDGLGLSSTSANGAAAASGSAMNGINSIVHEDTLQQLQYISQSVMGTLPPMTFEDEWGNHHHDGGEGEQEQEQQDEGYGDGGDQAQPMDEQGDDEEEAEEEEEEEDENGAEIDYNDDE